MLSGKVNCQRSEWFGQLSHPLFSLGFFFEMVLRLFPSLSVPTSPCQLPANNFGRGPLGHRHFPNWQVQKIKVELDLRHIHMLKYPTNTCSFIQESTLGVALELIWLYIWSNHFAVEVELALDWEQSKAIRNNSGSLLRYLNKHTWNIFFSFRGHTRKILVSFNVLNCEFAIYL